MNKLTNHPEASPVEIIDPTSETEELEVPRRSGDSGRASTPGWWAVVATIAIALLSILSVDSMAQGGWNRKLESSAILPTGQGDAHEVHIVWTVSVEPSSVPLDLSTIFEVYANGSLLASQLIPGTIDGGSQFCGDVPCNGSCGTGYFEGVWQGALLCFLDGPPPSNDCDCGQRLAVQLDEPCSLRPGDEIMVILRPAPGALPEPDTSDDLQRFQFHGGTQFWNRSVDSMTMTPVPGATDLYDVEVEGFVEWDGMEGVSYLPLSFQADLERNGVRVATQLVIQEAVPASGSCFYLGCASYCGSINGLTLYCDPLHFHGCVCGGGWIVFWPEVEWLPEDDLRVIIRPIPGALPELPGFEEDDEILPNDGTSSADSDVSIIAPARLRLGGPNPMTGGKTNISLDIDRPSYIRLEIIDAEGRSIRTVANAKFPSGQFDWEWDGRSDSGSRVANGVYFTTMWVDNLPQVEKLLVVR